MIDFLRDMLNNFDRDIITIESRYAWAALKPQAKQSTRFGGHAFTPNKKQQYINELAEDLRCNVAGACLSGNIRITALYAFPWTKKDYDPAIVWGLMNKRPDIDNLLKPLFDSIKSIICSDDGQICDVRARKIYFTVPCIAVRADEIRLPQIS